MENKCWFCEINSAAEEKEYYVALKHGQNRNDKKTVEIQRCERCEKKHSKGDLFASLMYILEAVLLFGVYLVFKKYIDLLYVAVAYVILMRPLTYLSKKIREKTAEPAKSVCVVSEHQEVNELIEEGYFETRRF